MDELQKLLKTIRGVSRNNPVTNLQLSEMIRKLWRPRVKILSVNQEAHGFAVGNAIKPTATVWVKAQADTEANARATGVVSEIIDADNFIYIQEGILPGDYTKGAKYYLSITTAGGVFVQSDPEVWETGNYRQVIGTGTADGLLVEIDEGAVWIKLHPPVIINKNSEDLASIGDDQVLRINKQGILVVINETVEPAITNFYGNNHESHLIENTTAIAATVESSWSVTPYSQQVGEFKATVMVRNKSINTIITTMSLLSFDYSELQSVVLQSDLITSGSITLTVGVNMSNKLYATISGMTTDNKRIHLCFERCTLGSREYNISAEGTLSSEMKAIISVLSLLGNVNFAAELSAEAVLQATSTLTANFQLTMSMQSIVTAYLSLNANSSFDTSMSAELFNIPAYTIESLFPSLMSIVNEQMDCYNEGTLITITEIDTVNHTITVSWIPNDSTVAISVTSPIQGKEWVLGIGIGAEPSVSGQDVASIKILNGNTETKVLNYDPTYVYNISEFVVGAKVFFYNIHNNGWTFGPLISVMSATYYERMTGPGGIYKHSDGTYRMVVNGYNNSLIWKVGLFSSPDLKNWTSLSSVAKIQSNGNDWTMDSIHVFSIIKHPTETTKYFGACYGQSTAGFFRIGWVKFDENMENIEFSSAEIISTEGTETGIYCPSLVYYKNKYRLFVTARLSPYFETREYCADVPEGPYTFEKVIINGSDPIYTDTKTLYMGYNTMSFQFVLNGALYGIFDGTGYWNASSNRGMRQFGIMKYNDISGLWEDVKKGLVIGSYDMAGAFWDVVAFGHSGGAPVLYVNDDGIAYFYAAYTDSTDNYQIYGQYKRIVFPTISKVLSGAIGTNAPVLTGNILAESGTTLLANCISAWEFDEISGTTANDSVGTKDYTHGMIVNQIGKINKCYSSTAQANHFINGATTDFDFGESQDFTVSVWVKFSTYFDYNGNIISKRVGANEGKGFSLWKETRAGYFDANGISRTNAFNVMFDFGTPLYVLSSGPNTWADNAWQHVIFYRRGNTIGLKLNGGISNEFTNANVALSLSNTSAAFSIFKNMINGVIISGLLDQTAIWSRALSEDEMAVLNNSNAGLAFSEW